MIYVWRKGNIVARNGDIDALSSKIGWVEVASISENLARLNTLLMVSLIRTNWINVQEFVSAPVLAGLRM